MVYFRSHVGRAIAMDVNLAVLADYANVSQDGKLNIMGIFQEVNAPFLPFPLPQMYLVLSLVASPAEAGSRRDMRVVLVDGDGSEVLSLDANLQVPHNPTRPGSRAIINEAIGLLGVQFLRGGEHAFSIQIGGDEKASVPLYVNDLTTGGER